MEPEKHSDEKEHDMKSICCNCQVGDGDCDSSDAIIQPEVSYLLYEKWLVERSYNYQILLRDGGVEGVLDKLSHKSDEKFSHMRINYCISSACKWLSIPLSCWSSNVNKECIFRGPKKKSFEMNNNEGLIHFSSILGVTDDATEIVSESNIKDFENPCEKFCNNPSKETYPDAGDLVNSSTHSVRVYSNHNFEEVVRINSVIISQCARITLMRRVRSTASEICITTKVTNNSLVGLAESIVDQYRCAFYSKECKDGARCMRHADIPGLFKTLVFCKSECSNLKVSGWPRTRAVVDDNHLHGIPHWSTRGNASIRSQNRMMPLSQSAIHANGSALRNASKIVDAIQQYKIAIKEAETDKDRLAANTSLGNLYQSLGENASALSHYEQSLVLSEKLLDYVSLGWAYGNMGNAYLGLFQKGKALSHFEKSLELTLVHESTPQAKGRAYNNLGTAYQSQGDLDKAQEHYDCALSQAVCGKDRVEQACVYGNMGNVLMLRKNYEEAVSQYSEVLRLSEDCFTRSIAHHNRGCAYYEWGETKMKEMYGLKNTSDGSKQQKGVTESVAMVITFYVHGPDFKDVSHFQPRNLSNDIAKDYGSSCEDLYEVVKFHEDHLDNIKGSSKDLTLSVSLFETNSRTFHRLQDCLVNLGEYVKALVVAEQSRARTLGELMLKSKGRYLRNRLTSPMPFQQIVANVGCIEHPVLYLSYTGARLLGWVFVSRQDGVTMNMFEVPLKDDQFDGKSFDNHLRYSLTEVLVEDFFDMYHEVGNYDEDTSTPVQTLYNFIAKPLLAIIEKCGANDAHKLVIITDSYTALLPFSSLHNPETGSCLGDRFSFQHMPSFLTMSILNQLSDINVVNLPTDAHNMCIVGNPNIPQFTYNDEKWNLGELPHAKREAESVAHILKTTPILEAQATKKAVLMRFMKAKIIHLATHGSDSSGFLAFGVVAPIYEIANSKGVLLYPEEVEKLPINPALVVLSSCNSGMGAVKADGIQSMARAFILAGAQAVLTALWRVGSAAIFMQFFYQYMMDGLESTKALQRAILSIRCFSKYSQYFHWSGYQLTGRDIYLKYATPKETHILEKRLGKSNVFPRLNNIKLLVSSLVDATCYPTVVQIFEESPSVDVREIVIDFIHSFYKHFTGGIYWINCEQPEFVTGSLEYIEENVSQTFEQLQLSELHQCLFVFDDISELPVSDVLLQLMANRYTHLIMLLYQHYLDKQLVSLIRTLDDKLHRVCKVHSLEPLSMTLSTQRIVYAMQQETHFCPKSSDRTIIERISNFTSGSPILVNIVSELLLSHFSSTSHQQEALADFMKSITIEKQIKHIISPPNSSLSECPSSWPSSLFGSSTVIYMLSSSSIPVAEGCNKTQDFFAGLLNACQFSSEAKILLDYLSHLENCPIPVSIVSSLSTIITQKLGKTHLASSPLSQLMSKGFVKLYPSPVVIHKNLKQKYDREFVYVPKCICDCMCKCPDKVSTLVSLFRTLPQVELHSSILAGLLKSLMLRYDLDSR